MGWLAGYTYRKAHTIIGTVAGVQYDYQMRLSIHYAVSTDSDDIVYVNQHCDGDDFDDIRFTMGDGTTEIDFWIEEYTASVNATYWVEINSIPVSPNTTTIYIYYGHSIPVAGSNGDNTFLFFDDFSGGEGDLDGNKWSEVGNGQYSVDINSSILYMITSTNGEVTLWAKGNATLSTYSTNLTRYRSILYAQSVGGEVIRTQARAPCTSTVRCSAITYNEYPARPAASKQYVYNYEGSYYICSANSSQNVVDNFNTYEYYWHGQDYKTRQNDEEILAGTDAGGNQHVDGYFGVNVQTGGANSTTMWGIDWLFIRNFDDAEPTHGVWDVESTAVVAFQYWLVAAHAAI